MKLNQPTRARIGLILLILFAGFNIVNSIYRYGLRGPTDQATDPFSVYLTRFDCLRDTLQYYPYVGYTDDEHWFRAQYSLAPTVLSPGFEYPLVVANFHKDSSENKTRVENELELLLDCSNGVRLYRGTKTE